MSQSLCVASGKGGVGKSVFTANLGAALARSGLSVVIVDADIGLRAQDSLLGLADNVVYDLVDVTEKDCRLDQALLMHPVIPSLSLLPAAQFARAKALNPERFRKILLLLKQAYDIILIDCPAGIERGLRNVLNAGVDRTLLITTPDDIAVRDAEKTAVLLDAKHLSRPDLIVNRLDKDLIHNGEMYSAQTIADTLDLTLLGEIPDDPVVYRSVLRHSLFIDYDCEARSALLRIATRISGKSVPLPSFGKRRGSLLRRLLNPDMKEVSPLDRY